MILFQGLKPQRIPAEEPNRENRSGSEQLSQDPAVRAGGGIPLPRGHQDSLKSCDPNVLQSIDGQEGVVDRPQPVTGNHDDIAAQFRDQIPHRKALPQGHPQTPNPLDEQTLAAAGYAPNPPQNLLQTDGAMMYSGGNQRSKRFRKKVGGDLVGRQLAVLNCAQEFCVGSAAGTEWLYRQRVAAALPQVVEEQSGQQGFANAGVGTGDKEDAPAQALKC